MQIGGIPITKKRLYGKEIPYSLLSCFSANKKIDDIDIKHGSQPCHKGSERLCPVPILDFHITKICNNPEIGVVGMGDGHGSSSDGNDRYRCKDRSAKPKVVIRGAMMPAVVVMATVEDPCAVLRIAERMKGKKIPRPASVVELA